MPLLAGELPKSDVLDWLHDFVNLKDVISIESEECPPEEVSQLWAGPFLVDVLIDLGFGPLSDITYR